MKKNIIILLSVFLITGCSSNDSKQTEKESIATDQIQYTPDYAQFIESFSLNAAYYGLLINDIQEDDTSIRIVVDSYKKFKFTNHSNGGQYDCLGSLLTLYYQSGIIINDSIGVKKIYIDYTSYDPYKECGYEIIQDGIHYESEKYLKWNDEEIQYTDREPYYTFDTSKNMNEELSFEIEKLLEEGYTIQYGTIWPKSEEASKTDDQSDWLEDYPDVYDYSDFIEFYEDHDELTYDEAEEIFNLAHNTNQ